MSLLDTYKQRLEAQIKEHKAQLDLLKAKARRLAADSKFVGQERLAEADKHLENVKATFNELKGAGGSALGEIKIGLKNALADLKDSTQKAAKHFNPPPPKPRRHRAKTNDAPPSKPAKHAAKVVKHSKAAKAVKRAVKTAKPAKAKGH